MMKWQPISTAPHETPVLLYCPVIGRGKIWSNEERPAGMENVNIVVGIKRGREDTPTWVCDAVESKSDWYGGVCINPIFIEPTHWMPLPDPPGG
jgi:hypothetical protein